MDGVLRVAQLNIGSLIEPGWAERRHEVVAWLDRLDADIVCFQEVWESEAHPNTAGWLAEHAAADWSWCFGGFPLPPVFGADPSILFGSAVLSRWPIDEHEVFGLPGSSADPAVPIEAITMELLAARTAGIDVFSTHLFPIPKRTTRRQREVVFIDDTVRAWLQSGSPLPPILCGDFNAEPDSDEIRFLRGYTAIDGRETWWQDAWRSTTDPADPGYTQVPENPQFAVFQQGPKRIDYVFVGDSWPMIEHAKRAGDDQPSTRGRVLSAALAFHEPITDTLASDHFGLIVEIGWPDRPVTSGVRPQM